MSPTKSKTVRERVGLIGDFELRQIPRDGRGRRSLARPDAGLQAAEARPHDAGADAEGRRQADRRFHARQSRREAAGEWFIAGSGIAEQYHMRWFETASAGGRLGRDRGAGPEAGRPVDRRAEGARTCWRRSRAPMSRTRRSRSWPSAGWISAWRRASSGASAIPAISATRSGWRRNTSAHVFETLMEAGEEFGIGLFGSRALNALRLEKNYGSWAREYRPIYGPLEAGLDRFVAYGKEADFIGKAGGARRTQARAASSGCAPSSSTPTMPTSSATSRSGSRRGARLGDVGRLCAPCGHVGRDGLCAEGDRRRDATASRSSCSASAMPRACSRRRCSTPISSGCGGSAAQHGLVALQLGRGLLRLQNLTD